MNVFNVLYDALEEAQATFYVDASLENLIALESAEQNYFDALSKARADWNGLPEGDRKYSAEINANDTLSEGEFVEQNELAWFMVATATYELLD